MNRQSVAMISSSWLRCNSRLWELVIVSNQCSFLIRSQADIDPVQDSSGGKTQDTKRGSGPLDPYGGPDSGNAEKAASKNVQKAASMEVDPLSHPTTTLSCVP